MRLKLGRDPALEIGDRVEEAEQGGLGADLETRAMFDVEHDQ
jgi:hypothetical protein